MTLRYCFLALALSLPLAAGAQPVWINEFHYDNTGDPDTEEFVEVAGPAATDLTGYSIVLYNGANGASYRTVALSGTIPDQQNGFGAVSFATAPIQNGSPDGIALADGSTLVQFLCYEGTFTAGDGPASGQTCTDVGVAEPGSDPPGLSLQLAGTGGGYSDFTWTGPSDDSPGQVNDGQTFASDTVVRFAAASGEAAEDDGTFALAVSITNPDETAATTVDVVFLPDDSSGDPADIGGFTSETVTFPAGSSDDQTVTVTLTDDALIEADETFVFELQNVQGGQDASVGEPRRFTLTLADDDVADFVFINELDSDTPDSDTAEFVELYDGGTGNTPLRGLVLVFFNGNHAANGAYRAFDLDAHATDAEGFFLAGNEGVDPDTAFGNGQLQDGPDAVALYVGDAADFPSGTAPTAENLVDAVVYGTSDPRDDDLLRAFGADAGGVANVVTVQFDEGYRAASDEASLQRLNLPGPPARGGGATASGLLYALPPSPRAPNPAALTVDETEAVADVSGWRLLSSPLHTAYGAAEPGPTVADYAGINLVQGVPGEYPDADPNLYHEYEGNGVYAVPGGTDTPLAPGQGFFWFWFDEDFGPFDGGTSRSYDLANPDFHLALEGAPPDDALTGGPLAVAETAHADGFYLTGNPFAYPLRLGAAGATGGTLHTNFGVWDPALRTYEVLTADFDDPYASAVVPVWNGVFAQVTGASGPFAITYTSAYVDPTADAALVGRRGALAAGGHPGAARPREARLALRLGGVADNGDVVADHAALLRFRDDAAPGWDRHDGSKMYPRAATVALVAPVGERDGAPYRQAVRSLPYALVRRAGVDVPVDFFANRGGDFALSWALHDVPAAWALRLRDAVTGAEVDLRADTSYAFASEATGWTGRFTLTVAPGPPEADAHLGLPGGYALSGAHPNPARTAARFTLRLAEAQAVTVALYDVLGRRVALLHDGRLEAGAGHAFTVDGRALASGLYLVRVEGETFADTRRLTLLD